METSFRSGQQTSSLHDPSTDDHLVSIIIATFQRPQHLHGCLTAIANLKRDGVRIEVCIANDGGPSIADIVARFPHVDIRFVDLPDNVGHVAARNHALGLATGHYIAFCDDDDRFLPNHIQRLVEQARMASFDVQKRGNEARHILVHSDAELVWLGESLEGTIVRRRKPFAWKNAPQLLRAYNPVIPSTILYSRSLHDAIGPFDEAVADYWDWDFLLRAISHAAFARVAVADVLYTLSDNGGNQSANPLRMRPALLRLIEKHGLGNLPSSNFALMVDDPLLQNSVGETTIEWDGNPAIF